MPIPQHWGDIVGSEWRRQHAQAAFRQKWESTGMSWDSDVNRASRNLNLVIVPNVQNNPATVRAVLECLKLLVGNAARLPGFPGLGCYAGEPCFVVLLGTKPNDNVGWFSAGQKDLLGRKMLAMVQVFSLEPNSAPQVPTFVWHVRDWSQQEEQAVRTRQAAFASTDNQNTPSGADGPGYSGKGKEPVRGE